MRVPQGAVWIGSDHPFDLHEAYLDFRRDVELASIPQRAVLTLTADSRYRLWINGTHVARGPSRCWPHAQQMDAHDITSRLRPGRNAIAVQVYSPGYSHFAYLHRGTCGLLAWLEAGGETLLVTDTSWRVQRDRSWKQEVRRVSIYGSGVERRNMALASDWTEAGLDEGNWKAPRGVAPAESPLWSHLQLRDVPLLEESSVSLTGACRFHRRGIAKGLPDDPHAALQSAWTQTTADERKTEPKWNVAAGECVIAVHDLMASRIGHGRAIVRGAKGGERLLIGYAEKLRGGDLLISDPETYCRMRPTDEFILRPGDQPVEPFSQRGGRYVIFCLHSPHAVTLALDFSFTASSYPVSARPIAGLDAGLQEIEALCWRTLHSCLQDGFVDSVWRESSQWLGDCVTQAFALAAVSDDARPLRRAITMAAQGAYPDGVLPSVLPGEVHAYTVVDYNFSWVELLDIYAHHEGATDQAELLSSVWPALCKMLERFDADRGNDGLIRSQAGRRLFLDWSGVDRREPSLTYNGRFLHALIIASRLAQSIGDHDTARIWNGRAERLRAAMIAGFKPDTAWNENTHGTPASQLGLALVLLTDCASGSGTVALCEKIIARSLDLSDDNRDGQLVLASPFMHHYLFLALEKHGRQQAILDIIRARWGRWAKAGEPTCWENWNVDFPDGSTCHGFSAHPLGWLGRCQAASIR